MATPFDSNAAKQAVEGAFKGMSASSMLKMGEWFKRIARLLVGRNQVERALIAAAITAFVASKRRIPPEIIAFIPEVIENALAFVERFLGKKPDASEADIERELNEAWTASPHKTLVDKIVRGELAVSGALKNNDALVFLIALFGLRYAEVINCPPNFPVLHAGFRRAQLDPTLYRLLPKVNNLEELLVDIRRLYALKAQELAQYKRWRVLSGTRNAGAADAEEAIRIGRDGLNEDDREEFDRLEAKLRKELDAFGPYLERVRALGNETLGPVEKWVLWVAGTLDDSVTTEQREGLKNSVDKLGDIIKQTPGLLGKFANFLVVLLWAAVFFGFTGASLTLSGLVGTFGGAGGWLMVLFTAVAVGGSAVAIYKTWNPDRATTAWELAVASLVLYPIIAVTLPIFSGLVFRQIGEASWIGVMAFGYTILWGWRIGLMAVEDIAYAATQMVRGIIPHVSWPTSRATEALLKYFGIDLTLTGLTPAEPTKETERKRPLETAGIYVTVVASAFTLLALVRYSIENLYWHQAMWESAAVFVVTLGLLAELTRMWRMRIPESQKAAEAKWTRRAIMWGGAAASAVFFLAFAAGSLYFVGGDADKRITMPVIEMPWSSGSKQAATPASSSETAPEYFKRVAREAAPKPAPATKKTSAPKPSAAPTTSTPPAPATKAEDPRITRAKERIRELEEIERKYGSGKK